MDFIERPLPDYVQHQAQVEDITLPQGTGLDFAAADPFDVGPSDGIGSQDFLDVDLGIEWDEVPEKGNDDAMSVDESVGVGRDAGSTRSLVEFPQLNGISNGIDLDMHSIRSLSRDPSEQPFQPTMEMDFPDFGGMDLGDLGIGFDEPVQEEPKEVSSRACELVCYFSQVSSLHLRPASPLTDVPDTPAPMEENQLPEIPPEQPKATRKPRERKQIIDSVTELYDSAQAGPMKDVSNIITEQRHLPRSSLAMRLLEIREDPLAHFLATRSTPNGAMFSAGPPGLAPELAELFLRPVETGTEKRRYISAKADGSKRLRLEEEDDEVEAGRRAMSAVPSVAGMSDRQAADANATGDFEFADQVAPLDDYQLELPNEEAEVVLPKARSVSAAPSIRSRLSTPAGDGWMEGEESYADATCPIAMFDSRQTQTQEEQEAETLEMPEEKGYSKNTVKALGFIRKELQAASDDDMEDPSMSFNVMATKVRKMIVS
jgi:cohesin complex subunit SCC1